jgi:hypothetical protein
MHGVRFLLPILLTACSTPGRNVQVHLPEAEGPSREAAIEADVGRLLSADPVASAAAARRLQALDDQGVDALLVVAARIPDERDPRWLNVLDENHALVPLTTEEQLDFLVWKATRTDRFGVMKAQNRLVDLARAEPDAVLARLRRGGPGVPSLAVALALAGERRAVGPLLARYRRAAGPEERRALAEAIAVLAGEDLRPPTEGSPAAIERAAQSVETWIQAQQPKEGGPGGQPDALDH